MASALPGNLHEEGSILGEVANANGVAALPTGAVAVVCRNAPVPAEAAVVAVRVAPELRSVRAEMGQPGSVGLVVVPAQREPSLGSRAAPRAGLGSWHNSLPRASRRRVGLLALPGSRIEDVAEGHPEGAVLGIDGDVAGLAAAGSGVKLRATCCWVPSREMRSSCAFGPETK